MSEYQNYSGNEFHTDFDFDTMITHPSRSEYEELCYFPERIIVVKDMWVRVNGLDNVMPIRTGLSREGTTRYRETEFFLRHKIFFNSEAHRKLEIFLHQQNCIAHGNGFNVTNTDLLSRNYFSLVALPPPVLAQYNSGTGARDRSAQNTYTDQEIAGMRSSYRVAHMLYLALLKINKEIANLFTVEDLVIVAATLLILQVTPEGWALDAALIGMAFAYAWFDGIKAVSMLIKGVSMAASANSNAEIEQAANMTAKGAVHLGLDIIIAFVLHKQIKPNEGIAVTPTKAKSEFKQKTNPNEWEPVDLDKPNEPPIGYNPEEFFTKGYTEEQADYIMNDTDAGKNMFQEVVRAHPDWPTDRIENQVIEAIRSGKTLPEQIDNFEGTLYKIQKIQYDTVHPNTIYFTTQEEINKAAGIASRGGPSIGEQFGLPQSSITDQYGIMPMQTNSPTTIFKSVVAPSLEKGITQPGGASQYFIFDQSKFNSLTRSGSLTNNGILGK